MVIGVCEIEMDSGELNQSVGEPVILDRVAFDLDRTEFLKKVHLQGHPEDAKRAVELMQQAQDIARPRAMYRVVYIDAKTDNTIAANGVVFTSRVLRVNLDSAHRMFPFVCTCGRELHEWSGRFDDPLEQFWAATLMELACRAALNAKKKHIQRHLLPGRTSIMSPGSLQDWPIQEQRPLFRMLGPVRERLGVELTDSCLMVPVKSLSGVSFPTEKHFESCQLCPRHACEGRRAPFDPTLYDQRYRGAD